jgi:hypothetical protein
VICSALQPRSSVSCRRSKFWRASVRRGDSGGESALSWGRFQEIDRLTRVHTFFKSLESPSLSRHVVSSIRLEHAALPQLCLHSADDRHCPEQYAQGGRARGRAQAEGGRHPRRGQGAGSRQPAAPAPPQGAPGCQVEGANVRPKSCFEINQIFSLCFSLSRARFSRFSRASPSVLICSRDTNFRRSAARKAAEDAKPKKPTRVLSLMTAFVRVCHCARA